MLRPCKGVKKKEKSGRNVPVLYVTDWMIGTYGVKGGGEGGMKG